jgi:prepilin-type N-terminal cleavage/methylation domain-containing protein
MRGCFVFVTIYQMKSRGFTLIELLVVISIIGMLSSIVLASVQQARIKASNTQENLIIEQYRNAFQLLAESNGNVYPTPTPLVMNCLGSFPDNLCGYNNEIAPNAAIMSQLSPYYSSPQGLSPVKFMAEHSSTIEYFEGPQYICDNGICGSPLKVELLWLLQGEYLSCPFGAQSSSALSLVTICTLPLNF